MQNKKFRLSRSAKKQLKSVLKKLAIVSVIVAVIVMAICGVKAYQEYDQQKQELQAEQERDASIERTDYNTFLNYVENDEVESVLFTQVTLSDNNKTNYIYYVMKDGTQLKTPTVTDDKRLEILHQHNVTIEIDETSIHKDEDPMSYSNLFSLLLIIPFMIMMSAMMKRMMPAPIMEEGIDTHTTFDDVAGEEEAKRDLKEIVDFIKNPKKYTKIGARVPKGALLIGPPGTGKTLLAKAVAGELDIPFFSIAGSAFVEKFVGVGASRVRTLFKNAKDETPSIIFIDEIDAIGNSRDGSHSSIEHDATLNQLLSCMDGFSSDDGVFVIAATNKPENLDKALLRPGRFDRRILVNLPDVQGREAILKVHSKGVCYDETVDLASFALMTAGASGAELANAINEACILAAREDREKVSQSDLERAFEGVLAGEEKKNHIFSDKEKRTVSIHETGHALVAALLSHTEPVRKITVMPRTSGVLGFVLQAPAEEKSLKTKQEIINEITGLLGGRAAEELCCDSVTTGASNDLEKATEKARALVTQYGMSEKIGLAAYGTVNNQFLDGNITTNCSEGMRFAIDKEIGDILSTCYQQAMDILQKNKDALEYLADYLFVHETITGEEFMKLLKEREEKD